MLASTKSSLHEVFRSINRYCCPGRLQFLQPDGQRLPVLFRHHHITQHLTESIYQQIDLDAATLGSQESRQCRDTKAVVFDIEGREV